MDAIRVAGSILAGGKGERIGGQKPLSRLLGIPMIEHVADVLRAAALPIAVVGDEAAARAIAVPFCADAVLGRPGPLVGLLSGLEWAASENATWLIVVPCDMPLLRADTLRRLLDEVRDAGAAIAYAVTSDGPEPLVSVWRTDTVQSVREAVASGHPAIWSLADRLGASAVHFGAAAEFLNVNTPEDLAEAERHLQARAHAPAPPPRRS